MKLGLPGHRPAEVGERRSPGPPFEASFGWVSASGGGRHWLRGSPRRFGRPSVATIPSAHGAGGGRPGGP